MDDDNAAAVAESVRRSPGAAAMRRLGKRHWLGMAIFVAAMGGFLLVLGLGGGLSARLSGLQRQARLLQAIDVAANPEGAVAAVAELADATADTPASRHLLAMAYLRLAAGLAPRPRPYWERVLREVEFVLEAGAARGAFAGAPAGGDGAATGGTETSAGAALGEWLAAERFTPGAKIQLRLLQSAILLELGREGEALAALDEVTPEELVAYPEHCRAYDNACAYLYATATAPGVRDPEAALSHALAAVPDWRACDDPALLDTLAAALAVNGRRAEALAVQRRAWGLAPVDGLWVYQDNWRKIVAAGAGPGAPAAPTSKEDGP